MLTARSSTNNKLEIQDGINDMQSHLSTVLLLAKGKQQTARGEDKARRSISSYSEHLVTSLSRKLLAELL